MSETAALLAVLVGSLAEGEIVIVGAAVLASSPQLTLHPVAIAVAAVVGTLIGDEVCYWVGRLVKNPYEFRFRGRKVLTEERRQVIEAYFDRHGAMTVFLLRYVFGFRTVGYFFAGAMGMPAGRFLLGDIAGTVTWVTLLVALGYLAGSPVLRLVESGWGLLLAIPVTLVLVWLVIGFQKRFEPDTAG